MSQAINKDTEQYILNKSFDEDYQKLAVEILTENTAGDALTTQKEIATEETLQSMADPLAKYKDAGMDVASNPMYFGYIALDGSWYIKKLDTTSGTTFCKGDVDYETNWINRASLTYELFNEVF